MRLHPEIFQKGFFMRLMACIFVLTMFLLSPLAPAAPSTQPTLKWGDTAPSIESAKWLKGTPVKNFEAGKTYVVEFWATWCGPCKAAMPVLSGLAKKYEGKATFVGIDIWEEDTTKLNDVQKFVDSQADNMAYNVAADSGGREGLLAKSWVDAAAMGGIPATFVVSDGRIVWTGHPDNLAPVLDQIVNKTYDMTATLKAKEEQDATIARINGLLQSVTQKFKANDWAGVDALITPDVERSLPDRVKWAAQRTKFAALLHLDQQKACEYARTTLANSENAVQMKRMFGLIVADTGASDGGPLARSIIPDTTEHNVTLSKQTYAYGAALMEDALKAAAVFSGNPDFDIARAQNHFGAGNPAKALEVITNAAKNNAQSYASDFRTKRNATIEALAKKYAQAAGVDMPQECSAASQVEQQVTFDAQAKVKVTLYDESADAKQQIAAAVEQAGKKNHQVLIQWGGNWCHWCIELHKTMDADKDIQRVLAENFEVVLINTGKPEGKNMDVAASYGANLADAGVPYLTILDGHGKVVANQSSGVLEFGPSQVGHDPRKVLAFLNANARQPVFAQTAAFKAPPERVFDLSFTDAISAQKIDVQKDFKGKIVVVDFWATWCGPCVAEMPKNKELYAKFKDQGVQFVGVSLDRSAEEGGLDALKKYVKENGIEWPQYHAGNTEFANSWDVTSIPTIFVLDENGKLVSRDARGQLETLIPELIAKRGQNAAAR